MGAVSVVDCLESRAVGGMSIFVVVKMKMLQ